MTGMAGVPGAGFLALQQQIVDSEAKAGVDKENLIGLGGELSGVVFGLIAWAVVITIGIAIMVGLVYKRMRSQQVRNSDRKSVISDTESGRTESVIHDSPSIIMVDDQQHHSGHLEEPDSISSSPTHLDMDAVEELYEETSKKEAQEEPLPRFGRALASNTGRIQGMFVPDNQANY
jgi:hypothetical protein